MAENRKRGAPSATPTASTRAPVERSKGAAGARRQRAAHAGVEAHRDGARRGLPQADERWSGIDAMATLADIAAYLRARALRRSDARDEQAAVVLLAVVSGLKAAELDGSRPAPAADSGAVAASSTEADREESALRDQASADAEQLALESLAAMAVTATHGQAIELLRSAADEWRLLFRHFRGQLLTSNRPQSAGLANKLIGLFESVTRAHCPRIRLVLDEQIDREAAARSMAQHLDGLAWPAEPWHLRPRAAGWPDAGTVLGVVAEAARLFGVPAGRVAQALPVRFSERPKPKRS